MMFNSALKPFAENSKTVPPYDQPLCSEADIPELDLSLSSNANEETQNSMKTSKGPVADSSLVSSSPPNVVPEDKLDVSALIDVLCARIAAQRDRIATSRKQTAAIAKSSPELDDCISDSTSGSATSQECTGGLRACSPMRPHINVDLTVQDSCDLRTEYSVYTCHHIPDTDSIVPWQNILEELKNVLNSQYDRLYTSRIQIAGLEKALRDTEQERDAAVQARNHAQEAENTAASKFEMIKQDSGNALAENRLLQQALQFAQRGYSTAQEEIKTLRRSHEAASRDRDATQKRMEALHEVLATSRIRLMNLRKDHEFAKMQSKGYLRAMQQTIEGHEAARRQLEGHYNRESQTAAARIADLERSNADLEHILEAKAYMSNQSPNGDVDIGMSNAGSSDPMVDQEQEEEWEDEWELDVWRVQSSTRVDDMESVGHRPVEAALTDETDSPAQQRTHSSWGVKSLRLPGAWGGRTK